MKNVIGLILGIFALIALAIAIPATASQTGPSMEKHAEPAEGYSCTGDIGKVPAKFKGAYKKACAAAKTEGKKPVRKMMGSMKNSLKKACNKKAPEGKVFKIGCKPCHKGSGKAGNTTAAGIKKVVDCDPSLLKDK